jgi:hypothetical protein
MPTFVEWLQSTERPVPVYILECSGGYTSALVKINARCQRVAIGTYRYECGEAIKFAFILATDTRIREVHFFADSEGKIENYLRGLTVHAHENSCEHTHENSCVRENLFCGDTRPAPEIIETDAPGIEWDSRGGRITIAQLKQRLVILEGSKRAMVTLVGVVH